MKRTLEATRRRSERGAVAVEGAIVLSMLAVAFTLPSIFWAFYFYKYSAAQKAVHDAALYLSTAPKLEMVTADPNGNPIALKLANKIVQKEMAGLSPPDLDVGCLYRQNSGSPIAKQCTVKNNQDYPLIQLGVSIDMSYLDPATGSDTGMKISTSIAVPYMGN